MRRFGRRRGQPSLSITDGAAEHRRADIVGRHAGPSIYWALKVFPLVTNQGETICPGSVSGGPRPVARINQTLCAGASSIRHALLVGLVVALRIIAACAPLVSCLCCIGRGCEEKAGRHYAPKNDTHIRPPSCLPGPVTAHAGITTRRRGRPADRTAPLNIVSYFSYGFIRPANGGLLALGPSRIALR
jgi:hypothetical protein